MFPAFPRPKIDYSNYIFLIANNSHIFEFLKKMWTYYYNFNIYM